MRACRPARFLILLVTLCGGACSEESPPPGRMDSRGDLFSLPDLYPPYTDLQGCASSSCTTGCCSGGVCVEGLTEAACGKSGETCKACQSGEVCASGECQTSSCDQASCPDGCCSSATCENGTSTSACGTGGGSCTSCKSGESCVGGSCTATTGEKYYKVTLVSGTIYAGGITICVAGVGGVLDYWCDPFVVLKVGKLQATSSKQNNNNTPSWNEELVTVTDADLMAGIEVDLYDADVGYDMPMGSATYNVTSSDLSTGTVSLDIKAVGVSTAQVVLSFTAI
jgi:hypothetical protein